MTNAAPAGAGEPAPGRLVDGAASLDEVIERCRAHGVSVVGLAAGPGEALGIHLGARVRDEYRRRLREAGLRLITVTAPPDLLAERPDEGIAADVADYLDLAADVGAESLTLTLTAAQTVARVAQGSDGEEAVARLRMLADRAAALDVAAVLQNAPAVPAIGQVIELVDLLHAQLAAAPVPSPAGADIATGVPARGPDAAGGRGGSTRARGPAGPLVIGAAWDLAVSTAAGEDAATGWASAAGLLLRSHGHVLAPDAAAAAALHRAVPASTPVPVLLTGHDDDDG